MNFRDMPSSAIRLSCCKDICQLILKKMDKGWSGDQQPCLLNLGCYESVLMIFFGHPLFIVPPMRESVHLDRITAIGSR
jgi:hypothetical protein